MSKSKNYGYLLEAQMTNKSNKKDSSCHNLAYFKGRSLYLDKTKEIKFSKA